MKPYLIDSHAHLQFDIYNNDREAILKRMQEKIFGQLILVEFKFITEGD